MKITYIKLENVAGISVGSNKTVLEISFEKSKNKIVCISGANGMGKSVLISSLQPFAGVTSLDERSTLSYIIPGKNGYKEIHYQNGFDEYVIKHYYKATKESHTVKSYFILNGEELNENGNVTSFLALVEMHFGLTQEMMRLIRLGTNVNSFITLPYARRKEYIGKLIDEINWCLKIYKEINEEIKVTKTLLSSNSTNLYNCHISDILIEEDNLRKLGKDISKYEKERDQIISKIGRLKSLMSGNNIDDLRKKFQEAESSLEEFERIETEIKSLSLENASMDSLIVQRSNITEKKIAVQSKINSYRISIDNTLRNIERLEISIKKITSNNDIQSLISAIQSLKESIQGTSNIIKNFIPLGSSSEEVYKVLTKLQSFNQISQMINTFGSRPIDVYLKLKEEGKSIDTFLKEQIKRINSNINMNDISVLMDQLFKDDMIITPNCDTEYVGCPYYRLAETLDNMKNKLEDGSYDDETLRSIRIISNNIDNVLNEIESMSRIHVPDIIFDSFSEKRILSRLKERLPFFDLSDLQEYLTILREYEIYKQNVDKLKQYENQLSMYKSSGIDSHLEEIKHLKESIEFYKTNISTLENEIKTIVKELNDIDEQIGLVTKFNDSKKYKSIFESTLESTRKILKPLENAINEKRELDFQLQQVSNAVNITRESHKTLETKINDYNKLTKERAKLTQELSDLTMISETASTKKGIPVIYMKKYLGKIQKTANKLLEIIYEDKLKLAKFNVTQDTFEVPYLKNGRKIPDIKYASQSEISLVTMALSFALSNKAAGKYNILLLDEIDAGLDEENRLAFLKMLYKQMMELNAEQVFIISQNLSQMINIPMDCIKLSDIGVKSKLQNIIYE